MLIQALPWLCTRGCRYEESFRDHVLAVRWVRGGRQQITFGARSIALDDDTYVIVNAGRSYDVRFSSAKPMESYAVYIPRGMTTQTFDEQLRCHDAIVSPVLRFLERHVDVSGIGPAWCDEQLAFLLERMCRAEDELARREAAVGAARQATRREIVRRVAQAADYIHSCYERPLTLRHISAAAALSPHHLLRQFKVVNGCTPREYLQAKRTRIAARLIATTELTLEEIAHRVGFEDRSTLGRQLRRTFGINPRQLRRAGALAVRPELVARGARVSAPRAPQASFAPGADAPSPRAPQPSRVPQAGAPAPLASAQSKARPTAGATRDALTE
jgi:AraC-like DNA-binding protein